MRMAFIGLTVAALALGACGKKETAADGQTAATEPNSAPAAAPAGPPQRKAGLWKQTMTADGYTMESRICTDEAFEKNASWAGANAMPGCCTQSVTPSVGGVAFKASCDMGSGGQSVTEGTASGDFASRYEVKAKSTVSGAAVPQMNRTGDISIVAEYQGPCPAGWAAGDMEVPGVGKISTSAAMAKAAAGKAAPAK